MRRRKFLKTVGATLAAGTVEQNDGPSGSGFSGGVPAHGTTPIFTTATTVTATGCMGNCAYNGTSTRHCLWCRLHRVQQTTFELTT